MAIQQFPFAPTRLYGGLEDGFYQFAHQFTRPVALTIRERDFGRRDFEELTALLPPADFEQVVREGRFKLRKGLFGGYVGSDGLPLGYYQHGPWLFVFASGEYQPALYKIYLEGVWEVRP
jgi:hypothetical protein